MTSKSFSIPTSRVLVIDDNTDITEMLKDFFETEDIECKIINDGREGLDEIRKAVNYNFILLDLTMPEFSGWDVFNKLKEEELLKSRNIIIFTASSKTGNEINELLKEGAKYVLRKPFSIKDVLDIVEKFIVKK
jgi:two-component system OmpR family response regulator